jgi:hypothetical protein
MQGEVFMFRWLVRLILPVAFLVWVPCCSTMVPERKVHPENPRILEEDVPDGSIHPKSDEEQTPSDLETPTIPPSDITPPGSRPPRRLPFKDRSLDRGMNFPRTGEPYVV